MTTLFAADTDLIGVAAIIAAVGSIVAAVCGAAATIYVAMTHKVVKEVHTATNGMKSELVEAVRAAALAAGEKQGRADQKAENGLRT